MLGLKLNHVSKRGHWTLYWKHSRIAGRLGRSCDDAVILLCNISIMHKTLIACWYPGYAPRIMLADTVETLYNTVNFCWNTHKRHSIARPKGRGMGVSFVSSKGNILCRLVKIELYKIFAIINRAIKGLHCTVVTNGHPGIYVDHTATELRHLNNNVNIMKRRWRQTQRHLQNSCRMTHVSFVDTILR